MWSILFWLNLQKLYLKKYKRVKLVKFLIIFFKNIYFQFTGSKMGRFTRVEVSDCDTSKSACVLKRQTNATISIDFELGMYKCFFCRQLFQPSLIQFSFLYRRRCVNNNNSSAWYYCACRDSIRIVKSGRMCWLRFGVSAEE